MRVRPRCATIACALTLATPCAIGQEQEEPSTALFTAFADEVELAELLEFWVDRLGFSLEYDPALLDGPVTIRAGEGITEEGLWATTNRILARRKLACVQMPGEDSLTIVPLDQAPGAARVEPSPSAATAGYVKALLFVSPGRAADLAGALGKVLTGAGSQVTALSESDQILAAGLKPQVLEAIKILGLLDGSQRDSIVEEIAIQRGSPSGVAALLERVTAAKKKIKAGELTGTALASPESGSVIVVCPPHELEVWQGLVRQFDRAESAYTAHYTPRRFTLRETQTLIEEAIGKKAKGEPPQPWRLVADELTGTFIVTTTPSLHLEIEGLLRRLESTQPAERWAMRSIPVRHRRVGDLLALLENLLESGSLPVEQAAAGSIPTSDQATGAQTVSTNTDALGAVTITADEPASRLLAVGSARMLDQIEALVAELDVQHPQVLVEALVLTLSESQTKDLSSEIQKLTGGGTKARLASIFSMNPLDPNADALPPATGSGFSGTVLDQRDFSIVIRALETLSEGRTLTIPKVLVNNNEDATLHSVLQSPFISINASNTVTTTSFGGTVDAGTTITVTPQIADGDQLILAYTVSLSSFVGEAPDPSVPPPRLESQIQSVVTVPDGHAIVVGGLEADTLSEAISRTPLLGSMPLIGALFRSRSETVTKTRFYVFLRCDILRSRTFQDLRYLSARDLEAAELDDGLPKLEPRLIR